MAFDPRLDFAAEKAVFETQAAREEDVLRAIQRVDVGLREAGAEESALAVRFRYWQRAYMDMREAPDRDALKGWVRTHMCQKHEHLQPPDDVSGGLVKSAFHLLWSRLYVLERPMLAGLTPTYRDCNRFTEELFSEIAAERGMTADQLMDSVCD